MLKSFQFKLFGSFILFGFVLSIISLYFFTKVIEDEYLSFKTDTFYTLIEKKEEQISSFQTEIKNELLALSKSRYVKEFTFSHHSEHLSHIFEPLLIMEQSIQKISIVDNDFNEKFKVIKYADIPSGNKYKYYENSLNLEIGESYTSKFFYDETLKIPYYKIIVKIDGGFIIADINLKDNIFNVLEKSSYKENWFLVDSDAKFIIHKNDKYNWSSHRNVDYDLQKEFPEDYRDILREDVYFNDLLMSKKIEFDNGSKATLLLEYKEDFAAELKNKYNDIFQFVVISILLVSIFLAYLLSKPFIRINKKISKLNTNLDKQVKKRTKELSTSLDLIDKYIITSKTDHNGKITYVSEAFCKVSGYSKEELVGKPHNIVRDSSSSRALFESLWETLSKGKSWSGEIKNKTKDGDNYYIHSNIEPLYKGNKIIGHMAVAENITDRKKLEMLNEELEQRISDEVEKNIAQHNEHLQDRVKSAQLTSIGQLAAGITHEINTPLTYIKGNVEMMKYDVEDIKEDRIRENLTSDFIKVDEGIARIENIIDTMREVSQANHENAYETNVYETLIIALNMISNRSKQISRIFINGQFFEMGLEKDEYMFSCKLQKQRVEQLWIVILNNALDALEKVKDYENRKIEVDINKEDKKIIVQIKDNAGGIPEDIIENVFDPVFTTKKHAGLGVGLNVAKKIVDDQKGEIKVTNQDGGAVFEVTFNVA